MKKMIANAYTALLLPFFLPITTVAIITTANDANNNDDLFENSSITLTGDLKIWDAIFSSRTGPETIIPSSYNNHNLIWTEGPTLIENELFFSDTVGAKLYALDVSSLEKGGGKKVQMTDDDALLKLRVVMEQSGDNPTKDEDWRAEPGSNGLFFLPSPPSSSSTTKKSTKNTLLVCQHGARRIAALDISLSSSSSSSSSEGKKENKGTIPLASEWNNRKLNGPNDIVIRQHDEGNTTYAYFTDPVYAWLEKDRFQDLPYLDERVTSDDGGPGHCGVYKFQLKWNGTSWSRMGSVELVQVMQRPNGIRFLDDNDENEKNKNKSKMIVSDCCQGSHLKNCKQGTSRWTTFIVQQNKKNGEEWIKDAVIESTLLQGNKAYDQYGGGQGCADGFVIHDYIDTVTRQKKKVLIASCSEGLCIVDMEQKKKVVTRLWTVKKSGCKVSNVAIGNEWAYLTGNCGIQGLHLREEHQAAHTEL